MMPARIFLCATCLVPLLLSCDAGVEQAPIHGRWDLTVTEPGGTWPMWLELEPGVPPAGRLQGRSGHVQPIADLVVTGDIVAFRLPSESQPERMPRLAVVVHGDSLSGTLVARDGSIAAVVGVRAPSLERDAEPVWSEPVDLLADGLDAWTVRIAGRDGWSLVDGELVNEAPSSDLITTARFTDFRLHIEVNVPESGNSGIYLRGRHEIQVQDDFGNEPHSRRMGGIYGQVTPTSLPAKPAGEWQSFDITLVGRNVTVVLNGVTIIEDREIPGITGGALDSDEGSPGPLMLQGDHSGIRYRNIIITPALQPSSR